MAKFKFDTNDNFPVTNDVFKGLQDEVEALKSALLTNVIMYEGGYYFIKKPTSLIDGFVAHILHNELYLYRIEKNTYISSDELAFQTVNDDVQTQGGGTITGFITDYYLAKKKSGQSKDLSYSDIKDLGKKNKGGIIKYQHLIPQTHNNNAGDPATLHKNATGLVNFIWNNAENTVLQVFPNEFTHQVFLHKFLKVNNTNFRISTFDLQNKITDVSFTLIYNNY